MTKIKMIQTKDLAGIAIYSWFLSLEFLTFKFVSTHFIKSGDIRISNFVGRIFKSCPLGLDQSRALWTRIFTLGLGIWRPGLVAG